MFKLKLSLASQMVFSIAAMEAKSLNSSYIDSEHLFLGLCEVGDVLLALEKESVPNISKEDLRGAQEEVRDFTDIFEDYFDPRKTRRIVRKIIARTQKEEGFTGHRTSRCKEVFDKAAKLSSSTNSSIKVEHLFLALLSQSSSILDFLFSELSVEKTKLFKEFGGENAETEDFEGTIKIGESSEGDRQQDSRVKTPFLDNFGKDLTSLAKEGRLDPCIGRKEEMKKVAQILVQKRKNNPILVGDPGVGKTCIVEGLVQRVVEPNAPKNIRDLRIIEVSMGSLVAGASYKGEFEERLESMVKEASSDPNIILFIDEVHTLVGAGGGGGSMDAANILKPALARGLIKCIGATTTTEYRKYIEKDPALERRFQMVWVDEPSKEEAALILRGLRPKFEEYHGVSISDEVIEKAIELSMRYMTDFRLPDKAIDIIDQACSRKVLKTLSSFSGEDLSVELDVEDVAKVVSERCRIPVENLTTEEAERLLDMEDYLRKRVMGQDKAVKDVAETIRSAKAGLKDPKKPVGVFLFLGSTGTGKSELAKALTEFLFYDESNLITFDMSEYQSESSISKLIGAAPGLVGYDEEGQLTGKVRTNPYSVILFDEVEKAHSRVFDIFLQIFDEGRLTDSHGRRANFSEAIIILTSNLGSSLGSLNEKKPIGVEIDKQKTTETAKTIELSLDRGKEVDNQKKWKDYENQIYQAINQAFRPEILNRIQKKIIFYPLERETVREIIVGKIIGDVNNRLSSKGVQIQLTESAIDLLMDKGYNQLFGARELQKTFDNLISEPLSQMILRGDVKSGQVVKVSADENRIYFEVA